MAINQKLEVLEDLRPKDALLDLNEISSHIGRVFNPQNLDDYTFIDRVYSDYPLIKSLISAGIDQSYLRSLLSCGSFAFMYNHAVCNCSEHYYPIQFKCHNRSCPSCSQIRKRRIKRQFRPLFRIFRTNNLNSLKFFTISPKNYKTIQEGHKDLRLKISRLLRQSYFKERIKGGIYVIETKESEDHTFNVHAHFIYYGQDMDNKLYGFCSDCQSYVRLKMDRYSKRFYCSKKSCNSINVVWNGQDSFLVRELKKTFKEGVIADISELKDLKKAINYTLKYVSVNKDSFSSLDSFSQYIVFSKNRRLINRFGLFYSYKSSKISPICEICQTFIKFSFVSDVPSSFLFKGSLSGLNLIKVVQRTI